MSVFYVVSLLFYFATAGIAMAVEPLSDTLSFNVHVILEKGEKKVPERLSGNIAGGGTL